MADSLMESRRRIILNSPHIASATPGDIVTVGDAIKAPLDRLVVNITPVQEGTGDPSPSNVRPISGWTGANIYKRGINIWDEEWELGRYSSENKVDGANSLRSKNKIAVKPSTTLQCLLIPYVSTTNTAYLYLYKYDKNGDFIEGGYWGGINTPITLDSNTYFINFWIYMTGWTPVAGDKISLNYPVTTRAYHTYNGTTYPITWQSEAGTVYGGLIDVLNGKLWVIDKGVNLGDLTWTRQTSGANSIFVSYISNKKIGDVICSGYKYIGAKSNEDLFLMSNYSCGTHYSAAQVFAVKDNDYATADAFKTAMADVQLVYPLVTPLTYQLTPTQVQAIIGENNIWADTGSIEELKYWAHP